MDRDASDQERIREISGLIIEWEKDQLPKAGITKFPVEYARYLLTRLVNAEAQNSSIYRQFAELGIVNNMTELPPITDDDKAAAKDRIGVD